MTAPRRLENHHMASESMALFDKSSTSRSRARDPKWVKSESGDFFRLNELDPEDEGLSGTGGVFVVWHGGVQPGWVFIGKSTDMAQTILDVSANDAITAYAVNGGLCVSWCPVRANYHDGVVRHLTDTLQPKVPNPDAPGDDVIPIPVLSPGAAAQE